MKAFTAAVRRVWVGRMFAAGFLLFRGEPVRAEPAPNPLGQEPGPAGSHFARGRGAESLIGKVLEDPDVARDLGLTAEQRALLKDASADMRARHAELRERLERTALKQAQLLTQVTVDEDAVMDAVEEAGRIRTELAKVAMRQFLTLRRALTAEQIESVRSRMRQRANVRRPFPGPRRGEGREPIRKPPERPAVPRSEDPEPL